VRVFFAQVGYENSSQCSREFKRLFGRGPTDEADRMKKPSLFLKPAPIPCALPRIEPSIMMQVRFDHDQSMRKQGVSLLQTATDNVVISIPELLQHDIPLIGIVKSQHFH